MNKEINITGKADIIISGAGIFGCIAAVTAAKKGHTVYLTERYAHPTGAFINQLIELTHDCTFPQILKSLEEKYYSFGKVLARLIADDNCIYELKRTDEQCFLEVSIDHEVYKAAVIEALETANVHCLMHTAVSNTVEFEGSKHVIIENKNGRSALQTDFYKETGISWNKLNGKTQWSIIYGIDNVNIDALIGFLHKFGLGELKSGTNYKSFTIADTSKPEYSEIAGEYISMHPGQLTYCVNRFDYDLGAVATPLSISNLKTAAQNESINKLRVLKNLLPGFEDAYVTWYQYDLQPATNKTEFMEGYQFANAYLQK